jgi:ornithine cyclodeaminase/alanine dehydrogenase-like protein (mu-crystallin family)
MRIFDLAASREALPFDRLIPALREMFASGCVVPPRHVHEIAVPGGEGIVSLIMPAWLEGRYYGVKTINIAPGNAARGLPGLHASYLLHDAATGVPLALIDGGELTARRTAAASALAASWLAPSSARRLLVVGAGRVARLLPDAYLAVRPIDHVTVWARSAAAAEAFVADLRGRGIAAEATTDLGTAVAAADIVSCATLATVPLIHGRALRPGSHLDLIGSFTPAMREADDACFVDASIYVDTDEALTKSGDLLGPMQRGVFAAADVRGDLASLSRGEVNGRGSDSERTVFKSVGTALEDLAAAILVHENG